MAKFLSYLVLVCLGAWASACVSFPAAPNKLQSPWVGGDTIQSVDGTRLAFQVWPAEAPKAVLIALHGMNDYSHSFQLPAAYWARESAITTYAYDQRGFGRNTATGLWAGGDTFAADLRAVVQAIRQVHVDLPVYVIGHSMGGAVVLSAMRDNTLNVDGVILVAPAVWGGSNMPLAYRAAINLAAMTTPAKKLTGERANRQVTDNVDILREMVADPLVIKETRIDAALGITRLMGDAWGATKETGGDILFLIGEKDEVIPPKAMTKAAIRLCGNVDVRRFDNGWHLLLRDKQAELVWKTIAEWVETDLSKPKGDLRARAGDGGPADLVCGQNAETPAEE